MKGKSIKPWRQTNVKDASRRNRIQRNQLTDLILHGKLITEKTKCKLLSKEMDKMITMAKKDTVAARRNIAKILRVVQVNEKQDVVQKLFEIAKKNIKRNGGYTRVLAYGNRKGDGSEIALITFTEKI